MKQSPFLLARCYTLFNNRVHVLASLLLGLSKVNVKSSIFIIEFENLTVSYFWLLICWWHFSFFQALKQMLNIVCTMLVIFFISPALKQKNVRYSVHNVNVYVNIFSFLLKLLIRREHLFYGISPGDCFE